MSTVAGTGEVEDVADDGPAFRACHFSRVVVKVAAGPVVLEVPD